MKLKESLQPSNVFSFGKTSNTWTTSSKMLKPGLQELSNWRMVNDREVYDRHEPWPTNFARSTICHSSFTSLLSVNRDARCNTANVQEEVWALARVAEDSVPWESHGHRKPVAVFLLGGLFRFKYTRILREDLHRMSNR